MKKIVILILSGIILNGCAGEQVGDKFETGNQECTTTMEYKWVWSIFDDSGYKKVPVTKCKDKENK